VLVTGIHHAQHSGARGWLDTGDKPRYDNEMLLWLKALHVIAVISWMAGLLYLPRLFVYHCEAEKGSRQSETFKLMEQRLLRLIMNPAMVMVWVTGPLLAWGQGMLADRWLWAKFALVVLLSGYHHALAAWRKAFAEDRNTRDPRFYRLANEVPTVLMAAIVVLVIVKPF
jgi:putative membrane protein